MALGVDPDFGGAMASSEALAEEEGTVTSAIANGAERNCIGNAAGDL